MAQHTRPYLHRAESAFCANRYVGYSLLILYCIINKVFSFCIVHGNSIHVHEYSQWRDLYPAWFSARWTTFLTQILHIHKHTNRDALDSLQLIMIYIFHVFNRFSFQGCKYVGDVELLKNPRRRENTSTFPKHNPCLCGQERATLCPWKVESLVTILSEGILHWTILFSFVEFSCRIFCNLQSDHSWTDQFDGVLSQVSGPHVGYA